MPSVVDQGSSKKPLRIIIAVKDITTTGGIQRFVAKLANHLIKQGHCVYGFTTNKIGTPTRFEYDSAVQFVQYESTGFQKNTAKLRESILACSPDIVIAPYSTSGILIWCAALQDTNIPLLYSERNDPWVIMGHTWSKTEREAALWAADGNHILGQTFIPSVPTSLCKKTYVVQNPVSLTVHEPQAHTARNEQTILALGRLARNQKQNHLLIAAFALIAHDFPKWKVDIWGDGDDKKALETQIQALPQDIQPRIRLCGLTKKPADQYCTADIFCIPSKFEGCPNTVLEAIGHGLPIVGFADCLSVSALVHHEENGLLAPEMTAESLADELRHLMHDTKLRQRLGQQAKKDAQNFTPEHIYPQWEAMIYQTASCKGHTSLSRIDSNDIPEDERPFQNTMRELLARPNIVRDMWYRRRLRKWIHSHPNHANMINRLLRKLGLAIVD